MREVVKFRYYMEDSIDAVERAIKDEKAAEPSRTRTRTRARARARARTRTRTRTRTEPKKAAEPSRIPYKLALSPKYPEHVLLCYMPAKKMIKEYVKVGPTPTPTPTRTPQHPALTPTATP